VFVNTGASNISFWKVVSSAYTASPNENLLADSTGGAFTITLPAAPTHGDLIRIAPLKPTYTAEPVTIDRAGQLISGQTSNIILNTDGRSIELPFIDGSTGWAVLERGDTTIINTIDAGGLTGVVTETGIFTMQGSYDFTTGTITGVVTVSSTAPASPSNGDFWFDTSDDALKMWYTGALPSADWVTIKSQGGLPSGGTASQVLSKIDGTDYNVQWVNPPTAPAWEYVTSAQTLEVGHRYAIDYSGSIFDLALPVSSTLGDEIELLHVDGDVEIGATPNLTSSQNIDSTVSPLELNVNDFSLVAIYINSTIGWKLKINGTVKQ
jgi:hypothetical protein